MGCGKIRRKESYPILLFEFEKGNEEQKNYCLKFKDKYDYIYDIKYQIRSNINTKFSIKFKIQEKTFNIQTEYHDSEEEIQKSLKYIYEKLDAFNKIEIIPKEPDIFLTKEEKNNLKEIKRKLLEKQKKLRTEKICENSEKQEENIKNEKINQILEDMCIYGNITKKEIKEEKKKNPEKFIETSEALKLENEDPNLFALGLISQNLENLGIETAIDKSDEDISDEGLTSIQFISNGMIGKKKYDLHFEFEEKRNEELLNNEEEYEKFKNNLKLKLSKDYNIPINQIIVTFPQRGSFHVQVIFQSNEFNDLDINEFKNKFKNDPKFEELSNLKEIHTDVIMGGCKLTKAQLDPNGNRIENWAIGENRGGKPYDPPLGWTGIGLNVINKYGDSTWIGMDNSPGEWCVAYHGVGNGQSSENVKKVTGIISNTTFKPGQAQSHEDCPDQYHPGKLVGRGVYCTPTIETASEQYAGISEINGIKYKTVIMVRVKPDAIRHCDQCLASKAPYNYWVVNGTTDEIRPYRILYKKC